MNYRPDIDGLRAIAVLSVLIFHLEPSALAGGFLGVDIFFVISGFLITGIIYREKLDGNFSYAKFYVRRAKRILPPIFLLLALVLSFGYYISLPYDYYKIGISTLSVLAFLSNMQFALRTGDYFSTDSSEWPLLHTWSLSVEEQYYFSFPLILFVLLKFGRKNNIVWLCALCVLSFLVAEYMSRARNLQSISYYMLPTRFGELLVGSILAILSVEGRLRRFKSNSLVIASLCIIAGLLYWIDKAVPFPGLIALAICLPVATIINSEGTVLNRVLSWRILVFIGLISYSLYLFHWPVLAFIRYIFGVYGDGYSIPLYLKIYALILIFFISFFSYFFVEKPLRRVDVKPVSVGLLFFFCPHWLLA